ncbi:MAG: BsuPI-related putative proteinase inhibitor [Peptococcales bacterium]|jgi:hypothetical protein
MKRKVVVLLVCVFLLNLLGPSTLWAKSDNKMKDFIPPGLIKNGKAFRGELPPPFKNMTFYCKGEIEGEIVYKTNIGKNDWIVVKSKDTLKSLMLSTNDSKYAVGDMVKVEYFFDRIVEIKIKKKADDDKTVKDLSYALTLNSNKVYQGEKLNFKLEVANKTQKSITTQFNSGQRYDFVIKKDGKKVWRWSDDYSFITVIQNLTFTPGQKETYAAEWVTTDPGTYTLEAYFMGNSTTTPVLTKEFTVLKKTQESSLVYQLEVVKGEPNLFILKVTNPLNTTLDVTMPTGQIFDFLLVKNGQKVWQWSNGQNFTQAVQTLRFQPKETKVYYAQYKTTAKGDYQLYGFFKGDSAKTIGPSTFTIQ